MVEKLTEFYFSKHPQQELDCGWSRKGSSYNRKEPIMANNMYAFNETCKFGRVRQKVEALFCREGGRV